MRILSLFRGIDLARTTGDIQRGAVYFASSRRKGKLVHQCYPVHKLGPATVCPQNALDTYTTATANYNGPELFASLAEPRRAIKSDTTSTPLPPNSWQNTICTVLRPTAPEVRPSQR